MTRAVWDNLLEAARTVHESSAVLRDFCCFPTDLKNLEVDPYSVPAAALMERDRNLKSEQYTNLRDAFIAASPLAHWRETYKDTDIGDDFMTRFGCYCLIGPNGAFTSSQMLAFVVYMPAGLWYPWHHHPAEELYFVLAGEAEFLRDGQEPETLSPGDTSFHASNQPHATGTRDQPVMAYVIWRNEFETPPVLTTREALSIGEHE